MGRWLSCWRRLCPCSGLCICVSRARFCASLEAVEKPGAEGTDLPSNGLNNPLSSPVYKASCVQQLLTAPVPQPVNRSSECHSHFPCCRWPVDLCRCNCGELPPEAAESWCFCSWFQQQAPMAAGITAACSFPHVWLLLSQKTAFGTPLHPTDTFLLWLCLGVQRSPAPFTGGVGTDIGKQTGCGCEVTSSQHGAQKQFPS